VLADKHHAIHREFVSRSVRASAMVGESHRGCDPRSRLRSVRPIWSEERDEIHGWIMVRAVPSVHEEAIDDMLGMRVLK
jgi:hypothetical protein